MICTLTARRIEPGSAEEMMRTFRAAVDEVPDEMIRRFRRVYVCRDVEDPNVLLTFGLFDGTLEELREIQSSPARGRQLERLAPMVAEVLLDGAYEVVEEIVT